MNTQLLTPGDIEKAAAILKNGGLVGIPTETVYGLGANGLDPEAVGHIFQAKGRPQDNPLILHIPEASWLERYCQNIPETTWRLAERFWPGPLTMILRRGPLVPAIIEGYFPGVFGSVQGALDGFPTKPDPTLLHKLMGEMGAVPADTLFVGDSNVDIRTAKNGGLTSCGVLWGFRTRAELEEEGAGHIAASPEELGELILHGPLGDEGQ